LLEEGAQRKGKKRKKKMKREQAQVSYDSRRKEEGEKNEYKREVGQEGLGERIRISEDPEKHHPAGRESRWGRCMGKSSSKNFTKYGQWGQVDVGGEGKKGSNDRRRGSWKTSSVLSKEEGGDLQNQVRIKLGKRRNESSADCC